jgi:hypothetical protein
MVNFFGLSLPLPVFISVPVCLRVLNSVSKSACVCVCVSAFNGALVENLHPTPDTISHQSILGMLFPFTTLVPLPLAIERHQHITGILRNCVCDAELVVDPNTLPRALQRPGHIPILAFC